MTPNKIVINGLLSYLIRDEDMPELVAWLNEHQYTSNSLTVNEGNKRLLLEIEHNEEMESQDDE